jgi:3-dehydrosphinganine reductase
MRHALITGGSSGIGLALAVKLARRNFTVSLLARDAARLAAARQKIQEAAPAAKVLVRSVDVGSSEACADAVRSLVDEAGPPAWAIACAGVVRPLRFLDQPISAHQAQMQTNYFGSLHFAHAVVPPMIANGGGKLVFIASAAAICGVYGYTGYGASKFAVRGLAEALRVELCRAAIDVTLVYAPDTATPQLAAERTERSEITSRIAASGRVWQPEDVADTIIDSAENGRFLVTPGIAVRLLYALQGLIAPAFRLWQSRIAASLSSR